MAVVVAIAGICLSCDRSKSIFQPLPARKTGIDFNNRIQEDSHHNVYQFMNFYTGAGVAVGDINNDGLIDLYFSGNMETGRLYLNKGDLKFQEITREAGLENSRWGTGATMVDINQDGWLDIYVCVSGGDEPSQRSNILFVNNGDNTFDERAVQYGIADQRQTQHAAFFDYDLDGDLDLFLIINPAAYEQKVNVVKPRDTDGSAVSTDVLYRNNGDFTFTDVSREAGILIEGYSLGVGISDINRDGWPDIYISNDFVGNDVLYMNQGDGTFRDQISNFIGHTSYAGMGNDLADFNNDGLVDIMVLDMRPEDNLRQKLIISSTSFDRFRLMLEAGYQPQYSRNTLQLNRGGNQFSEVGFMAGVSSTDWSWSALFADYDNDGDKDLFVTNGFMRDLGNLDYIHYQNIYDNPIGEAETKIQNKLQDIQELPGAELNDYLFENMGGVSFEKRSKSWGISQKGFSHGAVYVDLDNDGDLELVVNNINDQAHIYHNRAVEMGANYLQFNLEGPASNLDGIGTKIQVYTAGHKQYYENYLSRGYESSVDPRPHFGLGSSAEVDSIEVWWPDGRYQIMRKVKANQILNVRYANSVLSPKGTNTKEQTLLVDRGEASQINYIHQENDQIDFNLQPILPRMHAQEGPGMAVGDVNGDGLEDLFIGGAAGSPGALYIQQGDSASFKVSYWSTDSTQEDMGALFLDVEGDGDEDLYVVSGGTTYAEDSEHYQDRLYLNDGEGNFEKFNNLPQTNASGSSVAASDFDQDGDLDLFVAGRVVPGAYPMAPSSFLLRNDSKQDQPIFTDITAEVAELSNIGMVTSALWSDYNNDGWTDLLLVGEFMPLTVFHNSQGNLQRESIQGLENTEGWWNSLAAGDFDNDGDIDYVGGNLGLNSRYQASSKEPLCIYASDFDKNGRLDPVMCQYINGENHIVHTRDDLIKQINAMRVRFKTYEDYAKAKFSQSFLEEELNAAYVVKAHRFESTYFENQGDGSFVLITLPWEAQMSPVYGMLVKDFDGDALLDIILVGNSFATEVSTGRYDASLGLLLKGAAGKFAAQTLNQSGLLKRKDGKGIVSLNQLGGQLLVISNNADSCSVFYHADPGPLIEVGPQDSFAEIILQNGQVRKQELYWGSTYLSQSSPKLKVGSEVEQVNITDILGNTRTIKINKINY